MKKASYDMTQEEKRIHKEAVRLRKLSDKQLVDATEKRSEAKESDKVQEFIEYIKGKKGTRIGPAAICHITNQYNEFKRSAEQRA